MAAAASARDSRRQGVARPDLARLFGECVSLYLQLQAEASAIYRRGDLSGPRRTVLVALAAGPQTVTSLARARAQARQRFQPLVDALLADGLVERKANPSHKRAYLVALTAAGKAAVRHIQDTESALRAQLRVPVSRRRVEDAALVLHEVRSALAAQGEPIRAAHFARRRRKPT